MPGDLERALQAGWRVEVDLVNRRWRYARGAKRRRQWTGYYALDSVPGGLERIQKAQEESERQRQARRAARVGPGPHKVNRSVSKSRPAGRL